MKKLILGAMVAAAITLPAAGASAGPIAGARLCPKGYVGVIVYHGDYNTGGPIDLVTVCVPVDE